MPGARPDGVPIPADALIGTWNLGSYHDLCPDGEELEGPLGPAPSGLLLYREDGFMSVSMMRTGLSDRVPRAELFMGYAGTWYTEGHCVFHDIQVSSHQHMVGTVQERRVALGCDELVLRGTAMIDGRPRERVLTWLRFRLS
ncbi:lipocalin-like domain-containing protein [Amycolatopsis sp. NPDC052450]|uniref:lipocalin-like domain-containing protein n=1 Tax=Amycolatopsis sp. NPDC052450 TaxID=3363937 RepID=UPI0037C51FDE